MELSSAVSGWTFCNKEFDMPRTIAQRLSALEKTVAAFFGREKTQTKKAVKKVKKRAKRAVKRSRKSIRRKSTVV